MKEQTTLTQMHEYGMWHNSQPKVKDFSDMEGNGCDVFGVGECVILEFLEEEKFMVRVRRVKNPKYFEVLPELVERIYEVCGNCDKAECECKDEEPENEFNTPCLSDSERNPSMFQGRSGRSI